MAADGGFDLFRARGVSEDHELEVVDDVGFVELDEDAIDGHDVVPEHGDCAVGLTLNKGQATFAGAGIYTQNCFGSHLAHHKVELQFISSPDIFAGDGLESQQAVR